MTRRRGAHRGAPGAWGQLAASASVLAATAWGGARLHLIAATLVMAVLATLPIAGTLLTKFIVDGLTGDAPAGDLTGWVVALAVVGVGAAALPPLAGYLDGEIGRRLVLTGTDRLFAAVGRLPGLRPFEDPQFLDRLRMAQEGTTAAGATVTEVFSIVRAALTLTGFIGALVVVSPAMTVVVVLTALPALAVHLHMSRWRAGMLWRLSPVERWQFLYGDLLANVEAAKEIRLFASGAFLRGRMMHQLRSATAMRRQMDRRSLAVEGVLGALGAAVAGGGLVWAVHAARTGALSVGDVTVLVAAVAAVQGALASLVIAIAAGHHGLLLLGHYRTVVNTEPDLPVTSDPVPLPPLRHGIVFRDVWFRYSPAHPWVLRGVNLTIPAGWSVGLIGLNGAGKSTLVKLLCRFYDPEYGAILWDGVDLRDARPEDLRARISGVFQDYMSYDLSAHDNIGIGDVADHGNTDRIRAAAALARMDHVLNGLPRGYDTLLTRMFLSEDLAGGTAAGDEPDAGVVLSGGQWQRVALARAFFRSGRDLMILDEPSSGLDPDAEADLHHQTRRYRQGRTSLLISHRLNTVRDADLLIVLGDGVVAEHGTHDALMRTGGAYARLFQLQASGYRDRTPQEAQS